MPTGRSCARGRRCCKPRRSGSNNGRREDLLLPAGFQLERARACWPIPATSTIDDIKEFIALSSAREKAERKEREEALARDEARVAQIKAGQERTARLQRKARWTLAATALAVVMRAGGRDCGCTRSIGTAKAALDHARANTARRDFRSNRAVARTT